MTLQDYFVRQSERIARAIEESARHDDDDARDFATFYATPARESRVALADESSS